MRMSKRIATIKKEWKIPEHEISICPNCKSKLKPIAYLDYDSWTLNGWDCDNLCNALESYEDEFEWPFDEDLANHADLEAAGFVTV
jgi:hypothetical protein